VRDGVDVVDLASDQTSLHIPFTGGYYPAGLTLAEGNAPAWPSDPAGLQGKHVQASRCAANVAAVNALRRRAACEFWDYGNAFLLECEPRRLRTS
jgi:urocanate hydratase